MKKDNAFLPASKMATEMTFGLNVNTGEAMIILTNKQENSGRCTFTVGIEITIVRWIYFGSEARPTRKR
jgi:hypothetical protein